jgi:hypothetical protein
MMSTRWSGDHQSKKRIILLHSFVIIFVSEEGNPMFKGSLTQRLQFYCSHNVSSFLLSSNSLFHIILDGTPQCWGGFSSCFAFFVTFLPFFFMIIFPPEKLMLFL